MPAASEGVNLKKPIQSNTTTTPETAIL